MKNNPNHTHLRVLKAQKAAIKELAGGKTMVRLLDEMIEAYREKEKK